MHPSRLVIILLFFCVFDKSISQSILAKIEQAAIEHPTDLHPIIDASPGSNSLQEHLESIIKLDNPIETVTQDLKPIPADVPNVPQTLLSTEPNESTDLKTDASGWNGGYHFGYGGYHSYSPYHYQLGNPYYSSYWQYNRPYYNPYNYYYPGQYYYNPYRRRFPGFYY